MGQQSIRQGVRRAVSNAVQEKPGAPSDTAASYPQPSTEAGTETGSGGLMGRTTLTRPGAGPVMTNDTIDQDMGITQAAVVRLPRRAAVRADLDAARMPIMPTLYPGSHSCVAESRCIRHEMTADKPSRPLGAASTTAGPVA